MACNDLLRCMLAAMAMFVMAAIAPLFLYWLWIGLPGLLQLQTTAT
mgnify:CR=1 FL=1